MFLRKIGSFEVFLWKIRSFTPRFVYAILSRVFSSVGDINSTVGDTISSVRDTRTSNVQDIQYRGGHHQYIGGSTVEGYYQ